MSASIATVVPAGALARASRVVLAGLALATVAGAQLSFSDQTAVSGLTASPTTPTGPVTSDMVGGAAIGDFDADGWQDVFLPMCGTVADRLYMNQSGTFTDQAVAWGVDVTHIGAGTAVGDYNNDGTLDLYVTSHGTNNNYIPGQHKLYRNRSDAFVDVADAAGVRFGSTNAYDGYGAAFGDADLDGDLDLFVCGWQIGSLGNVYFQNDGDGTFTNVTSTHIDVEAGLESVRGFTPLFVDMNDDRYPELLIAGDFDTSRYLVNNGDGTFDDQTASSGTGFDQYGMGQFVADINQDGRLDWYVTSIFGLPHGLPGFGNMLYFNQGSDVFIEAAPVAGVDDGGWGWGTVAVDLDHNGAVDIVETNGWFQPDWVNENSYVFLCDGAETGTFQDAAAAIGLVHQQDSRGLAHFDYDRDGDQDLLFVSIDEPVKLFRNDVSGPDARWLRVKLDSGGSSSVAPDGYGAKVEVTAGGTTQVSAMHAGGSFLSQSELVCHFGLGSSNVADSVRVTWPDGQVKMLLNVSSNQTLVVGYEGLAGKARKRGPAPGSGPAGPPKTQ